MRPGAGCPAGGALTRLVDMGIEPYLVASSLEMVLAQRLVRLICPHCREEVPPGDVDAVEAEIDGGGAFALFRGTGCRHCQGTGYHGRTGVFELMVVSEAIRGMILEQKSAGEIGAQAAREGVRFLRQDGWRLVRGGKTTLAELFRVTKDGHAVGVRPAATGGDG